MVTVWNCTGGVNSTPEFHICLCCIIATASFVFTISYFLNFYVSQFEKLVLLVGGECNLTASITLINNCMN